MKDYSIALLATRAYAGVLLQVLFANLFVKIVLFILTISYVVRATQGDALALVLFLYIAGFAYLIYKNFLQNVILNDALPVGPTNNLAQFFSSELVIKLAKEDSLTTYALLRSAVRTKRGVFILNEIGISESDFLARFSHHIERIVDVYSFLVAVKDIAKSWEEQRITGSSILYYFFQHGGPFTELLNEKDLSLHDFENLVRWERFHNTWNIAYHTFIPEKLLAMFGTIGRSWILGYTSELDRLTTDLSIPEYTTSIPKIRIHQPELETAVHILSRTQQKNVLILGKPGVGKRTFVRNLAQIIRTNELRHSLPLTRVLVLHTEELLSGSVRPDMVLLDAMKRSSSAGKFILVIENIAVLLRSADANLQAVFSKLLSSSHVSVMAIASAEEYHSLIKNSSNLEVSFEKILLSDSLPDETMEVLMMHYFTLEEKRHMHITYKGLKSVLDLSGRYIGKGGFPGKAIAVLNDAVMSAKRRGDTFVTEVDVKEMISLKAHMDIRDVSDTERTRLMGLETALQHQVIGQNRALAAVANSLKRARMQVSNRKKPIGTFLFLGPTGVGKTETAKALAKEYFGSVEAMIRLDMNEYSTENSIEHIIGGTNIGSEGFTESALVKQVQDRPFSLVLLDEIEKAHPKVLNLFLQILDEGILRDHIGLTTDFRNTIIIATSNAGAIFIRNFIAEHQSVSEEKFQQDLISTIINQGTFSPEFINRFDEVLLYYPLTPNDALKVAIQMIDSVIQDLLSTKGIYLRMDEDVVTKIAKKGYSQEFGAREMRRTVTDMLENYIANYLLHHDVRRGEEIYIRSSDID